LRESTRRKEEHSKKMSIAKHVIFDEKDLVREHVIIKKEGKCISLRSLERISKRRS